MNRKQSVLNLLSYFSPQIGQSISKISDMNEIHEIRLRSGHPVGIVSFDKERFITEKGNLTDYPDMCRTVSAEDVEYSFRAVCDYSIHSYKREISEGFVTLEGGNRVGICGTAVTDNGNITTVKYISGLNFRIAGQALGCAESICERVIRNGMGSILVIGAPMSGKTTIIRDMCRIFGNRYHVSVIDERGEIGAVYQGVSQNDVGRFTDVFDGYPKVQGIITAVRVMSPDIVVCDEIGGKEDCDALLTTANMGVKIIASVHGKSYAEIARRHYLKDVIESGIFEYFITLDSGKNIGKVVSFERNGMK